MSRRPHASSNSLSLSIVIVGEPLTESASLRECSSTDLCIVSYRFLFKISKIGEIRVRPLCGQHSESLAQTRRDTINGQKQSVVWSIYAPEVSLGKLAIDMPAENGIRAMRPHNLPEFVDSLSFPERANRGRRHRHLPGLLKKSLRCCQYPSDLRRWRR